MREIKAGKNEAGQRLIRVAGKYLNAAPDSFLYKMLRKKNIVLNGKKAGGREVLKEGDTVTIYLSEETISKFKDTADAGAGSVPEKNDGLLAELADRIIYEDENVILVDKPSGMLAQKAQPGDLSMIDLIERYLLDKGEIDEASLETFRPGLISRLDRNTSGLIAAGKTLRSLQELNALVRTHRIRKVYEAVSCGIPSRTGLLSGYWVKDRQNNKVRILPEPVPGSAPVKTHVELIGSGTASEAGRKLAHLKVEILTGKSHQIRAHLAAYGAPLYGDVKYGGVRNRFGKGQMLHAQSLAFPRIENADESCLAHLSGKTFNAPLPASFRKLLTMINNGE